MSHYRGRVVVLLALAGAVAATALLAVAAIAKPTIAAAPARAWPGRCPRGVVTRYDWRARDFAAASRAAQAQIRRVFGTLDSQGKPAWHDAGVSAVISLSGIGQAPGGWPPAIKGIAYYKRAASHACGHTTAIRSLVAFLTFPECQLPCGYDFAFLTLTRRGWYMWQSHR